MKVKNQHQQVIWYLKNMTNFSLSDVINHAMFYKFQSRMGEIEREHGKIATRTKRKFTNVFGRKSSYFEYNSCVTQDKLNSISQSYD